MQKEMHSFATAKNNAPRNRSIFDFKPRVKTSFNQGVLVPIYCTQIIPGDTFKFNLNALIRMSAQPLKPVLDDAFVDLYAFWCPSRILFKDYDKIHGANPDGVWAQTTEWVEPQLDLSSYPVGSCSILDYLGVQVGQSNASISALPLAAYHKIWNDWFRDENYEKASAFADAVYDAGNNAVLSLDGTYDTYDSVTLDYFDMEIGDMLPLPVNKYHDFFTSVLPQPQKAAEAVSLPLGDKALLGAYPNSQAYAMTGNGSSAYFSNLSFNNSGIKSPSVAAYSATGALETTVYADLTSATGATISDLFYSIALQNQYINDSIGGTRYTEILKANYGVAPTDGRLDRPEMLGSIHQRLNMTSVVQNNVAQNSSASLNNATGSLGASSTTGISESLVNKSFDEFGWLLILGCVRVKHTYTQGVPMVYQVKRRFDNFYPSMAGIGEQPVPTTAIYGGAGSDTVFGYQEAWGHLKFFPDQATGKLRKGANGYADFQAWTYADEYSSIPVASPEWLFEGQSTIGNTTVLGGNAGLGLQFIADFQCDGVVAREVPANTRLRLIDVH